METAIAEQPPKPENDKRRAAIQKLQAGRDLNDNECRNLGDAVFALLAPAGYVIVTTNVRDHRPLARALGKDAVGPEAAGSAQA